MSLLLATALASATSALPSCSWDRPGHNPFTGDVVAAVDRYSDIPPAVRDKLKARLAARQYDEIVNIGRDSIKGKARYGSQITGMHFGAGQVCGTVSRAQWSSVSQERGLVYCESGHCILVPTVCRNVSRIQREEQAVAGAVGDDADPAAAAGGGQVPGAAAPAGPAAPPLAAAPAPPSAVASQAGPSFADGAGLAPTPGTSAALPAAETGLPGGGLGGSLGGGTASAAPAPIGSFGGLVGPTFGAGTLVAASTPALVDRTNAPSAAPSGTAAEPVAAPVVPVSTNPLPTPQPVNLPVATAPVPEPGTWALMALGLGGLLLRQRRARQI